MQNIENTVEGQGHFNGSKVCDKHISMFNCVHKGGGRQQLLYIKEQYSKQSKELYILTGTETSAEKPKFGKLLGELESTSVRC